MKNLLFILLFLQITCYGQGIPLLKDIKFDDSTKLIGMYAHYDKNKTYENYNFCVTDIKEISELSNKLVYQEEVPNMISNEYYIIVLRGDKIVKKWSVSLTIERILIDGHSYRFDSKILKKLAQKHSFKYDFSKKTFENKSEFLLFEKNVKSDKNFLFLYAPDFRYEGSFELEFKKSQVFPHPKAICTYLQPKLDSLKAQGKDTWLISKVSDYNTQHREQCSMTLSCSYDVYKDFQEPNAIKKVWQPTVFEATIFKIRE
jgi:hypothetical protein